MSRFRRGDAVVITASTHQDYWSDEMDKYIGDIVVVDSVYEDEPMFVIQDKGTGDFWWFYDYHAMLLSEYNEPGYSCDLEELDDLLTNSI